MTAVLMVAFHYPPCAGSSGVLRTLKYSRYLPDHGWRPIVLTAHPRAYERTGPEQLPDIPPATVVRRAFALDSGRHLAFRGKTVRLLMLPDRWVSWALAAIPSGLALIRRYRVRAIWSTYPIASAHLAALALHRLTGLPWVADFRDSMTEDGYPRDRITRRAYRWIERGTIARAAEVVFTTESTRRMYFERYPDRAPERSLVIPNGYDDEDFRHLRPASRNASGPVRLLHAGVIYPEERDPRPFFRALARLKDTGQVSAATLRVDLRASGSEPYYAQLARGLGVEDLVHLLPPLPYREALQDCAAADALLLLQAASCNHQIPAKAYEYLRIGKPILALTSGDGDTAALLRQGGGSTILDLASEEEIARGLPGFLDAVRNGAHGAPSVEHARRYSRQAQAAELANHLQEVVDGCRPSGRPPGNPNAS